MVGVARNLYGVWIANQYKYYKLTPPTKQPKNPKTPDSDPEVAGCSGVWWTHAETRMKSASLTAGDCHTGLDSSRTNCLLQRYKFCLSLGLPLSERKEEVAVVQSKHITVKAACFPLVLGTFVASHWYWGPDISDLHCPLATINGCRMSAASQWGAGVGSDATRGSEGQALESRGRSVTEMGISVLGATAQKPEGGF